MQIWLKKTPNGKKVSIQKLQKFGSSEFQILRALVRQVPRLSIRIVILVLPSDTETSATTPCEWMRNSPNLIVSAFGFPQIWLSGRSTLQLSRCFQALCDKVKWNQMLQTSLHVRGRAEQSFPPSLVTKKWLYLASTFFASTHRGSWQPSQYL